MASRAEKLLSEPRPNDGIAMCLREGAWHECIPAPTDEVRRRYHDLAIASWVDLYDGQTKALQDRLGDDIFVAKLSGVTNTQTNESATYAVWPRTVPTLLPRAEYLVFTNDPKADKGIAGFARWDKVQEVLGKHLVRQEYAPERWATGDYFPSEAELKKLELKAKPF
jgi:hypothetical protein